MAINADTEVKTKDGKPAEDWMNKRWRPMMGWSYMATCITDFVIFPVLWSILQTFQGGQVTSQWNPITLQGAGLYHLAMGAVLGVAAWSRGQEKMASMSPTPGMGMNSMGMGGMGMSGMGMNKPINNTYSPTSSSYNKPATSVSSRSALPDTDMDDADNMIGKR